MEEAFAASRPAHRLLVTPQRRQALEKIVLHATTLRIPIVEVEGGSLTALAGFDGHQGIAVVVEARRFASVDDILARSIERGEPPFVLALDSLEDPQNVGTLLRSGEGTGIHGVIFPTERQAPLSPAAVKASAGATEHLLLAPVEDLAGTLTDLRLRGVRIVGSEADAALTAREADLRGPIVLVVGSEGHGLSPAVRRRCDLFVRLPMRGVVGSLNAAVAGSVLLFEILGQRDGGPAPAATGAPATAIAKPRAPSSRNKAAKEAAEPQAAATEEDTRSEPDPARTAGKAAGEGAGTSPRASITKASITKASTAKAATAKASTARAASTKATAKPNAASKKATKPNAASTNAPTTRASTTTAATTESAPRPRSTVKSTASAGPKSTRKPGATTPKAKLLASSETTNPDDDGPALLPE